MKQFPEKLPLDIDPISFDLEVVLAIIQKEERGKMLLEGLSREEKFIMIIKEFGILSKLTKLGRTLPQA